MGMEIVHRSQSYNPLILLDQYCRAASTFSVLFNVDLGTDKRPIRGIGMYHG